MKYSFSLRLALATSCLLGCATDDPEIADRRGDQFEIVPVELRPQLDADGRPIPGTLEIDSSSGRMDLTSLMPERPREFRSWEEFHEWLVAQLNARIDEDDDGIRRARLSVAATTTLRYDADRDELVEVEDVAEAVVGGTFGYVLIDGALVCTSTSAPCAREQWVDSEEPDGRRHHAPNAKTVTKNGFGIEGATWVTHLVFYHSVGSETRQTQGGIRFVTSPCGFLKWCTTTTGNNFLSASFSAFRFAGSIFNFAGSAGGHNTLAIRASVAEYGVGVGSSGVGPIKPGLIGLTTGTCARHHGNDNQNPIDFFTADGQHPSAGC